MDRVLGVEESQWTEYWKWKIAGELSTRSGTESVDRVLEVEESQSTEYWKWRIVHGELSIRSGTE